MSAFFACLRLEHYVGCLPSTLRSVMEQLEILILETTEGWERDGIAQGQIGPIVGTVDETSRLAQASLPGVERFA